MGRHDCVQYQTIRICPICNTSFRIRHPSQRFCSKSCRIEARRLRTRSQYHKSHNVQLVRVCPICQTQFTISNPRQRYCSKACRNKAKRRQCMASYNKHLRKIERTCVNCGQVFTGNHRARYCPNCYNEWKRTFPAMKCAWCGKVFEHTTNRKYCSQQCYAASRKGIKRPQHAKFMRDYMEEHPDQHVGNHLRGKTYEEAYGTKRGKHLRDLHRHPQSLEAKIKLSDSHKKLWQDPEFSQMMGRSFSARPNDKELQLNDLLKENALNFGYIGDFQLNLGGKFPDFVHIDKPLLLELFGEYWHEPKQEQERIDHFAQFGYRTLIIWCNELKDSDTLIAKITAFVELSN